jgi:hypothetical protein
MHHLIVIALVLLAGCADTSRIVAKDYNVFTPSGRMSIDVDGEPGAPSVPRSGHALELSYSGGRGDGRQELNPGSDPVVFGGRRFNSPTTLDHEFRFRFLEGTYRYRKFFRGAQEFGIEARGGIARAELDLTVTSPPLQAQEQLQSAGIVGGFGLIWSFRPRTSLQPRVTLFAGRESEDVNFALRGEVHLVQALARNAALRAGYAGWNVQSTRDRYNADERSPIRVITGGFALGLDVMF